MTHSMELKFQICSRDSAKIVSKPAWYMRLRHIWTGKQQQHVIKPDNCTATLKLTIYNRGCDTIVDGVCLEFWRVFSALSQSCLVTTPNSTQFPSTFSMIDSLRSLSPAQVNLREYKTKPGSEFGLCIYRQKHMVSGNVPSFRRTNVELLQKVSNTNAPCSLKS